MATLVCAFSVPFRPEQSSQIDFVCAVAGKPCLFSACAATTSTMTIAEFIVTNANLHKFSDARAAEKLRKRSRKYEDPDCEMALTTFRLAPSSPYRLESLPIQIDGGIWFRNYSDCRRGEMISKFAFHRCMTIFNDFQFTNCCRACLRLHKTLV